MENLKDFVSRYVILPASKVRNPEKYVRIKGGFVQVPKKDILSALGLKW